METLYVLAKSLIDPVALVVALLAAGTLTALVRKQWRVGLILLPALATLYAASISPVANGLCLRLEKDYLPGSRPETGRLDVVIALGGGIADTVEEGETLLSQSSAARLLRAVQVFRESGAAHLLCAGKGVGRQTEATVMARAAERLGVPRESLLEDSNSENTRGHAIETDRRFSDKNIRIGLVSSAYHLRRSEIEFKKYFPNVYAFSSDFLYSHSKRPMLVSFIPNAASLFKSAMALHEMTGLLWYRLKRS